MATDSSNAPIRFSGPPGGLTAPVELAKPVPRRARIAVGGDEFPLRMSGDGQAIDRLVFAMPDATPPGEYDGEVLLDDARHDAVIDVRLRKRSSIDPPSIAVRARSGGTVETTLRAVNRGNASLTLDVDETVTLRQPGALGKNLAQALKRNDLDLADRLVVLGREIQQEPSHEVPVRGRMVPSTLDVGGHSEITVEFALPEEIETGMTWSGMLGLLGTRVRVHVEPLATPASPDTRGDAP